MIRLQIFWQFAQWLFMRTFRGCFESAKNFRYELKKGGYHTGMAILGFLVLSLVSTVCVVGLILWLVPQREIGNQIYTFYLLANAVILVYNIFKALFELFEEERQDLLERLKR